MKKCFFIVSDKKAFALDIFLILKNRFAKTIKEIR